MAILAVSMSPNIVYEFIHFLIDPFCDYGMNNEQFRHLDILQTH